jgi:hypothetical protein
VGEVGGREGGGLHISVTFAKVPEADLVEVVQPDGLGDGVDEARVGDGRGDDVGEVELEEVEVSEDRTGVGVADEDLEQDESSGCHGIEARWTYEDEKYEGEKGGYRAADGKAFSYFGGSLDVVSCEG